MKDTRLNPHPEWLLGGNPGAIENQEREGQEELTKCQALPIDMTSKGQAEEILKTLGVKFGEPIDDLFINVVIPEDWSIEKTEHHMWSNLINEKSKVIGEIFYKAAFYDRSAFFVLNKSLLDK